ncbi:hypothetical protein Aduo_013680 [Ancylostoma duodenale]
MCVRDDDGISVMISHMLAMRPRCVRYLETIQSVCRPRSYGHILLSFDLLRANRLTTRPPPPAAPGHGAVALDASPAISDFDSSARSVLHENLEQWCFQWEQLFSAIHADSMPLLMSFVDLSYINATLQ